MFCPSYSIFIAPLRTEGAGNAGCTLHPRSRVRCLRTKNCTQAYRAAEADRHPLRNGFTTYIVLSPVSTLVVTVAGSTLSAYLAPPSRRQDPPTSPYALGVFVW